jgi:hypothetical protein
MNLSEATELVAILQAHAPHHQTTEATFRAWQLAMEDVPIAAAMLAAKLWMRHHKHFPYPAELREIIGEQLTGLPSAEDAWQLVLNRMRGSYFPQLAEDWDAPWPVQQAVQSIGGIHALRMSERPGLDAKRFADAYAMYRERAIRELDITTAWKTQLAGGNRAALTAPPERGEPLYGETAEERWQIANPR